MRIVIATLLLASAELAAAAAPVARLNIAGGVVDGQVVQRRDDGTAAFNLRGDVTTVEGSTLRYRILRRNQTAQGFDWTMINPTSDGTWSTEIDRLPTGGPYRVELLLQDSGGRELDRRDIDGLLVGDLWVLAGQSNMDGTGDMAEAEEPHEMVRSYSLAGTWQVAEDPLHWCYESIYPVYLTSYVSPTQRRLIDYAPRGTWPDWRPQDNKGAGLGIFFGKTIYENTGVPVGLIVCSLGGSTMQQWSPDLRDQGDKALYGAMLMRIEEIGGAIKGVLWYQGESDTNSGSSQAYQERLTRLIQSVRADQRNVKMPFYIVQLARMVGGDESAPAEINAVRAAQLAVAAHIPHSGIVAAIDLGMSSGSHLDTDGYKRVGRRLANIALAETYGSQRIKSGPRCTGVSIEGTASHPVIRVRFTDVNGAITPAKRISGFTIRGADGADVVVHHLDAAVAPDEPNDVLLHCDVPIPPEASLWYGHGWDPYCNLRDEADTAVPAFGPTPLN